MNIKTISVGPFHVNCYLIWGDGKDAIVIDPGSDAKKILRAIEGQSLRVAAILLTHGHCDHVSAVAEVHREHPAPIAIHPEDGRWAFDPHNQLLPYYEAPEPAVITRELADGQEWTDAGFAYRVIATPGHSPGGVCFYFPNEKALFSGDTLFDGSVGRTDLIGGSARVLTQSLAKLVVLPDETRVHPGHGDATTIGKEKRNNYFMRGG